MNLPDLSVEVLLRRSIKGDEQSAAEFFDRYSGLLNDYVSQFGLRGGDLDEVVHQVFVAFFHDLAQENPKFDLNRSVEAWLRTIAKRKFIDFVRRNRRQSEFKEEYREAAKVHANNGTQTPLEQLIQSEEQINQQELILDVQEYLNHIPLPDRELVRQKLFEDDFSYRKYCLANNMEPTEKKIHELRGKVFRILMKLRKSLTNPDSQ